MKLSYDDLIERIARNMCVSDSLNPDGLNEIRQPQWYEYVELAEAALSALQEYMPEPMQMGYEAAKANLSLEEIEALDVRKLYQQLKSLGKE